VKQIEVALEARSYPVLIGERLLDQAAALLEPFAREGRLVVVTDENVFAALGARLREALSGAGMELVPIVLPPGEGSKSWKTLAGLIDRLVALGIERSDYLLAFGGGMVGDLTGFAAAILKRGCPYVQLPTSLLAQVDSSVGGKTAINIPAGKNMVGAFHQPSAVLIDVSALGTLPERELRAGYAEVMKYGLLGDADFFRWCEANGGALLAGDGEARLHAVEASVRAKAAIVAEDERETSGRRVLLNLGHTFGHALEAETGFSDRLLHGEAVALGMALAFRFSAQRGLCSAADAERVERHLLSVGLPTSLAAAGIGAAGEKLVDHMAHDKKKAGGRLPFILARGIGAAAVDGSPTLAEVADFLDRERGRARPEEPTWPTSQA
jgi:3-dehydroquinate synthase